MKSTDDTFLVSIENANEKDAKAMIIDMYYDSTVPGSYLNGEYTEGSIKLTNRRIMGINNPTTTSIFQDLMQVLEAGFTIGKIALYNKELNKDEFDSEAFHKGFAVRHSTFEKDATTHLFRDGHKELTPGEYLLPFETLYLRVDVPEGYTMSGNLKSPLTDFLAIPYLNVGVTSQRPGNADNGFQFFDMTLRKPIWWNGSSWVDANGATV